MQVTIKLFATFQKDRFAVEVREVSLGTSVLDLVEEVRIDVAAIGVILANGRHVDLDYELRADDIVAIFPVIGGG